MPRPGCNLALGLKKVRVCRRARVGTPEPRRRPCDTKWLQWIKSEWDLWINRGRSLVDWNDGQIDEPLPAEIGSWFALCIPSIPLSGGKVPSQRVTGRRRQRGGGGGSGGEGEDTRLLTQSTLLAGLSLTVYHRHHAEGPDSPELH